jgi:argininosuccinate synthase
MTTAVLAFSGGLDTSFLVPYSREKYGVSKVITCTVNTGGFDAQEAQRIAMRSKEVGADRHVYVDASKSYYDQIIKFLIYGNVSRDGYPLCVSSERLIIAQEALRLCDKINANYFIHGSTGAGNDQYRFDVAAQVLGDGRIVCKAPVREFGITREFSASFLRQRGVTVTEKGTTYSYNPGLWGVSIGGGETLRSDGLIPEDAWYSRPLSSAKEGTLDIAFDKGRVSELKYEGQVISDPVSIIRRLAEIGNDYGIGRHYHVGTSVPGKKGRLAYESPAADIIYEAHRTLEKIVMTQAQITGKKPIAEAFGQLVHEAKVFDPYLDDLKAHLTSSQRRVTGTCHVVLAPGYIKAVTAKSPYDLLAVKGAVYGETSTAYNGTDAAGSALIHGFEQRLYHSLERGKFKRPVSRKDHKHG